MFDDGREVVCDVSHDELRFVIDGLPKSADGGYALARVSDREPRDLFREAIVATRKRDNDD